MMTDLENKYTQLPVEGEESPPVSRGYGYKVLGIVLLGAACLALLSSNSGATSVSPDAMMELAGGPAMIHFPEVLNMRLPPMPGSQGSKSYMADVGLFTVPGKETSAGLYRLDKGPSLNYTYTYEEYKFVAEGEFHLTDGTGQKVHAKAGDLVYFPMGTNVLFESPTNTLGYYVGQRNGGKDLDDNVPITAGVTAAIKSNPKMVLFPQIHKRSYTLPYLANNDGSNSYLGDLMQTPGVPMTAGLYRDNGGPTLHYTYTYNEFKLILEGEFDLEDGTGQKVKAKAGDLMQFPKGSKIRFATETTALGFFVGQREEAAPMHGL